MCWVRCYAESMENTLFLGRNDMLKQTITFISLIFCASLLQAVTITDWQTLDDLEKIVTIARQNKKFLSGENEEDVQDWKCRFFYRVPSQQCVNSKGEYKYGSALYVKVLKEDDGAIVGYIAYHTIKNKKAGWIYQLALDPNVQGRGYAKQLILYALNDLCEHGMAEVSLGVLSDNIRARGLYEHIGFKQKKCIDDMTYYTYCYC